MPIKSTINGQYIHSIKTAQPNIAPSSKQLLPPLNTVDSHSVLRRLQSELMALMMSGDSGISAFLEEDNMLWNGTIKGSKDTVFEGTEYNLSRCFPNDYPFKPPKLKFENHLLPSLCRSARQHIFLDIPQDKCSSAYDVRTILLSIQSLLREPKISSPLNPQAAQLWSNQEEYRKMVQKLYKFPSA